MTHHKYNCGNILYVNYMSIKMGINISFNSEDNIFQLLQGTETLLVLFAPILQMSRPQKFPQNKYWLMSKLEFGIFSVLKLVFI